MTELLTPDWKQPRPTFSDVQEMCGRIELTSVNPRVQVLEEFIAQVRKSHDNGGAHLALFDVGSDHVFDWFASRNRLTDEELLDTLLTHPSVQRALPELFLAPHERVTSGLAWYDEFLLDGTLARILYNGGAYSKSQGDGRREKALALSVCEGMFGLRFGEVSCYISHDPWTSWFKDVAWDVTAVVFDRRKRKLWILTITDTD
jgi:hypothetical protein